MSNQSRPPTENVCARSWTPESATEALSIAEQAILQAYRDQRKASVRPRWSSEETAGKVGAVDFNSPIGLGAAIEEAANLMRGGDLLSASARCFGYFNPTAAWPAVIADLLSAARNPQICVQSHAPASVAMERRVIAWFLEQLGFPAEACGNFCSGGSEANATALQVALVRAHPEFASKGLAAFNARPSLYASADSHLAWIKIARAAGLGSEAVRLVPTSGDGRMDTAALAHLLESDAAEGWRAVMIAATAGTTSAGEIDPLRDCHSIAKRHRLHFHVDAAWAGALVLDPARRIFLDGISEADSVTVDAHKWLSVPMGAGMVLLRDRQAVARAFAVETGYMPAGDGVDAYLTTSQWSRRFVGLRLWMMLRSTGVAGYTQLFARQFQMAERLRTLLVQRGWRIRNTSPLPVILFEDAQHGRSARSLADALEADGRTWLGCVRHEGQDVLRACFTSFLTEDADVDLLLDRLEHVR
ncbi:MAG TPA: aminotransferase class V-fold PLP-dependent enzyme [Planctomycetaceae bacterium]|nr:aminotransferase class V-fold PLP-dependent enzyme [Planctomycetaceae bacterium]